MSDIIRMTPEQARRCKVLIKNQCCNYFDGNCILLDDGEPCVCPQSISYSLNCKWFRTAVLPNDKELYIRLMKPENTKICAICGKHFPYRSNREQYCNNCKHTSVLRRKKRYRENKKLHKDI